MFFHVRDSQGVYRKNTVLAARFNGHVSDGKPVIHGQMLYTVPHKLHGFIQRAVHANHTDNMQDNVLAANPLGGFPGQVEFNCGGNFKPCLTCSHACRHIRAADSCGESAQCPVGTGVGIRADNHISGNRESFLGQEGMFDSHLSHFKIIGDFIAACKFPHAFAVLSRFDIFVGHEVVWHQGDFILVEHAVHIHLLHFLDGYRACNVVAKYQIQVGFD